MDPTTERLSRSIWIGVGLIVVILCLAFVLSRLKPADAAPPLPVISQVADFALTNQDGRVLTLADLRGQVWVADIIFTRCAGPCPRMTRQMEQLQAALPQDSRAQLVTLTTDPGFDTPEVLKRYATRFNANPARWNFLTGTKLQIAALAVDSLKLTAVEKKPEERTNEDDLFIHSTIFVVVDKQGRLRGAFETEAEGLEWKNVQSAILAAVKQLEREP
jgi:cytochrome oxidase Cu insertion factor (SCO1/SenC/PrrC family)